MLSFKEYIKRENQKELELYKAGKNTSGAHRILLKANREVNINEYAIYILRNESVVDGSFCRLNSYLASRDELICIYTTRTYSKLRINGKNVKTFFLNGGKDVFFEDDDVVVLVKIDREEKIKTSLHPKFKIKVNYHG